MTIALQSVGAATRAYQLGQATPAIPTAKKVTEGPSFEDMIVSAARSAVETVHAGDRATVAGLRGEMPTQQVVEAVMAMESTLRTTVAIRDKFVESTQEILRMAV